MLWLLPFLLLPALGFAASPADALQMLLSSSSIDREQTSVYIWDLDADYQVAAHRSQAPITPASVMKCVSTAALASSLPYGSVIKTQAFIEGSKKGDAFEGEIIVVGAGDPSLGDGRHDGQPDFPVQIARAMRDKGIRTFRGKITIDENLFAGPSTPPSWDPADLREYYGTGFHALNFEGNASGKKAVAEPSAVFKRKLMQAMDSADIKFEEEDSLGSGGKRQLLAECSSPSLGNLMRSCMFRSDNLYAETFLRLFGLQNGSDGSASMSAKMAMQHWDALNYPLDGVEIVDGSGLSRSNRLTAEFLGMVLRSRMDDPEYVSFFPLVGEEGTVKSFMKDTSLQGRMALKTGSMSGIQSYAGYVLDGDYMPTHVVVVITNGLKNRGAFRDALSRFFLSLFE